MKQTLLTSMLAFTFTWMLLFQKAIGYYIAFSSGDVKPPHLLIVTDKTIQIVIFPFRNLVNAVAFKPVPLWKDSEAVMWNKSFINPALLDVLLVLVCPNPTIKIQDVDHASVTYPVTKNRLKDHIQTEASIARVSLPIFLFLWVSLCLCISIMQRSCSN